MTISGYLGTSDQFDETIGDVALSYADQLERDRASPRVATRMSKIIASQEA